MSAPLLVTGASGFVGRHVLEALQAQPDATRAIALVRDPEAWKAEVWTQPLDRAEPVRGDVLEPERWSGDLPRLGGILHLAALVHHSRSDPGPVEHTNVQGTLAMVRLAATQGCRLVFMSTSGTVGCSRNPDDRPDEAAPWCDATVARWPYYRSKIAAERQARALAEELGVELVIVRPPVLLGPGDHRFRSTSNVIRMLRGRLPFLIRGGMHFCDVRDVAGALLVAVNSAAVRPVYHLPGTESSVEEFFALVEQVSGVAAPKWKLPYGPAHALATALRRFGVLPDPVVVEMGSHYWGLSSRFAEELGYRPRDPERTLRDTVDWLQAHHPDLAGSSPGSH